MLQIEDLSQQVYRAAAEKFKVPSEPSALVPESAPGPRVRPECEEEEEEEEEGEGEGAFHDRMAERALRFGMEGDGRWMRVGGLEGQKRQCRRF